MTGYRLGPVLTQLGGWALFASFVWWLDHYAAIYAKLAIRGANLLDAFSCFYAFAPNCGLPAGSAMPALGGVAYQPAAFWLSLAGFAAGIALTLWPLRARRPAAEAAGAAPDGASPGDERLRKAAEFIEQEEGAINRYTGVFGLAIGAAAVAMSLVHLYAAFFVMPAETLRAVHVGAAMALVFLLYPAAKTFRHRLMPWDVLGAALAAGCIAYLLLGGEDLRDRATLPNRTDMVVGVVFVLVLFEALRRSNGMIMVAVVALFVAYAIFGPSFPAPWTHRGYDLERLTGHLFLTLEGIFGSAVDVSATLIILFTIYGAVLNVSGAGKFFIDFSFAAMGGKPAGAGRTIVAASFLLGGPSGSGVATTVTLGSVAYPMLARAGYARNAAGGLLAAGGIGAIISPPVLGAAAFLIAEYLKISYLDVILMAAIPTVLYYVALFVMVEIDARKYRMGEKGDGFPAQPFFGRLACIYRGGGHHFLSLVLIIVFMLAGLTPMLAVVWATVVAGLATFLPSLVGGVLAALVLLAAIGLPAEWLAAGSGIFQPTWWSLGAVVALVLAGTFLLRTPGRLTAAKLLAALREGSVGMLNVAITCAAAGIIVGVVTLTGLGLKFSAIIIDYAGGSLVLTVVYTALIVWIVGLAVPVTASYIICAVIAAPALIKLGVPDFAAHMFIFYYAVLSEVSPPTALSPFAAAAITGGGPYATTLQAWKYALPAFVVPLAFVLEPNGVGLLLATPKGGGVGDIVLITAQTALGIAALAAGSQGWFRRRLTPPEIAAMILSGALLVAPRIVHAIAAPVIPVPPDYLPIAGAILFAGVAAWQLFRATPPGTGRVAATRRHQT